MDFNLGLGQKKDANACNGDTSGSAEVDKLTRCKAMIKEEIAAVRERIAGLKAISGKKDFLAIPTSFVSNPAPVIIVSTDLRLREANESFASLSGLSSVELAFGSDARALFAPERREQLEAAVKQLDQSGLVEPFESELVGAEGKRRAVLVCMTKMGPTDHECFMFFLDMAARKAMQKELAIKQSNLAALAEAIPQLIWVSDAEGLISYANEHFRQYTGAVSTNQADHSTLPASPGAVNWKDFLPSDNEDGGKHSFGTTFSVGQVYSDFQSEVRLCRADGTYLWHLLRVVPFFSSGSVAMQWLILATEIDEQKKLTDSLVVAEEQLRLIADAMPQIVWTANAFGLVDFLNHRWFEYTGLTGEQSLHGGWRLLIHTDDLGKYEESWRRAVKLGEPFEVEFRLKRVLGLGGRRDSQSSFRAKTSTTKTEPRRDYLWHLCRAVPLKTSQGLVVRWFGTWTEIDEHKARLT